MKEIEVSGYEPFVEEIKHLIHKKQYHVLKLINAETINLYWEIGEEIHRQQEENGWGKFIVQVLSKELQKEFPGAKGYSAANLWRMRNFYLSYCNSEKLAPLVREISWSNNVVIMEKCKDDLVVGSRDIYIDLLLFHRRLRSLVAIELKIGEFEAEYAGKMQLYLTALDEQVKLQDENPSIGIIICKSKDKTYVEYALKQSNVPIGVATYQLSRSLPEGMKEMLPEPEEIVRRLRIFEE